MILFYGLALLFFTVLPSLPLDRTRRVRSLSFARPRRVPVLLARVIYLSALARSFPQPRVKELTSHHLDRPPSFSPPYLLTELFLFSLCPFRFPGRSPRFPLYLASSLISFARRWIGERRFFHTDATRGIGARQLHIGTTREKTYWDSLRTTVSSKAFTIDSRTGDQSRRSIGYGEYRISEKSDGPRDDR